MTRAITPELVEPVVAVALGVTDVDGGPTDEQRAVLRALVAGYWRRDDLDIDAVTFLGPDGVSVIPEGPARSRVRELLVLLELCRHPASDAQVDRVDMYADALGESGPGLDLARSLVRSGARVAMADYYRFLATRHESMAEPSLRAHYAESLAAPDPELGDRLRGLHDLPAGTLGHEYVEFYRRNGITLPGDDPSMPAVFVAHDMSHVIAGYAPVGVDEIALGGMQLVMTDTVDHWAAFLGNLAVHEAAIVDNEHIAGKTATLARPGAAERLGHAMWRGAQCTGDFTAADHLAMADWPLADVRARFTVPPLEES